MIFISCAHRVKVLGIHFRSCTHTYALFSHTHTYALFSHTHTYALSLLPCLHLFTFSHTGHILSPLPPPPPPISLCIQKISKLPPQTVWSPRHGSPPGRRSSRRRRIRPTPPCPVSVTLSTRSSAHRSATALTS